MHAALAHLAIAEAPLYGLHAPAEEVDVELVEPARAMVFGSAR